MDEREKQLQEMEDLLIDWLIGCASALCECGSFLLLPDKHTPECPYRVAAESRPEGWVSVDDVVMV